jgi:RNA polymerase sigma factor (sigma-70 family)
MARTQMSEVLQHIRRTMLADSGPSLTDQKLLEDFIHCRDESALAVLVHRHAAMVWGVCRRVLGDYHDAEDAFQATFLVLVRKASSIASRELLANWLYGVAHQTALNARTTVIRRRGRERQVTNMPEPEAVQRETWHDLQALLDQELSRLPDKYRIPIVLCDLEGMTRKEAAGRLGCPEGTVAGRLARARVLLAKRLVRHGLPLSAGALAALLAQGAASACAPSAIVSCTIRAACLFAAGQHAASGAASAKVVALAEGVIKAMLYSKLKTATALLVLLAIVGTGIGRGLTQPAVALARIHRPVTPVSALAGPRAEEADPDSDGDGLSDFHEIHKYHTDPKKKDTAGLGVSDGDWQQRREFTYSVRAVIRVMPPYNLKALNDDYQDVRVRKETKEFVELEVVAYPFNTNAKAIRGNPNWKKDYAGMKEYLAPGVTTNWDEQMRKDLLRELARDGIDPDGLTDKEVVEQVSRWLFKRSKYRYMFCTFHVGFADGKPRILPGLEKEFHREKGDPKWSVQEQLENEVLGREMFVRKSHGTCTSTAVLQTTVLRALGIPTRMILCIPLADGSDQAQVERVDKGLKNHRVRCDACLGALSGGTGFTSHTFCEVFVGGRWRRLNYTTLGQNIIARNYLGLMIHVHTFKDLSDANLAATWGTRYAKGQRSKQFPHSNPYRLMEVSDHFGKYAKVPNPPADKEHRRVTIDRAYWPDAKDAPAEIRELKWSKEPGSGRFFIHCHEWFDDAGEYLQYKLFMRRSDRKFILRAKGQTDVACELSQSFFTLRSKKLCELEVVISPAEYGKMASGVAYTLHPVNGKKEYEWKVREGLTLTR